jgi:hypothetical protein
VSATDPCNRPWPVRDVDGSLVTDDARPANLPLRLWCHCTHPILTHFEDGRGRCNAPSCLCMRAKPMGAGEAV